MSGGAIDFFVSYNSADTKWAEWISWVLEAAGYRVRIQAWDFVAGSNFVLEMQRAATEATRTIAVLSPDFLKSGFAAPEWAAAFANDPTGLKRSLVPVLVRRCNAEGLLKQIVYIDLVGLNEEPAEKRLLEGIKGKRAKPSHRPNFPGVADGPAERERPKFPGDSSPEGPKTLVHIPKLQRPPSDLEKRRFIERAFLSIVKYFENALEELTRQNEGVETDFKEIGPRRYRAEIFIDGRSRALCRFWIAGNGIAYSEVNSHHDDDGSYNEMLTLAERELVLTALMGMFVAGDDRFDTKRLSPETAADYLWRRFISRIEGS
ncbi:toll/interleukin-1 receptor domain-containing protein [Candidatus Binatus sp.]|jgi:hypothetical protein|uniref:toll/interleukin-1 receptor domain-containing protein n=1 Tax=Candidatus Binatus sp. TaxID=2811406 RepID=UPI003BC0E059